MGGSSGGGSSVQQQLPPPQLAPAYQTYGDMLNRFMGNPGGAFQAYQGPTQPATSGYTQQAISALADPANFLQSNRYFQDVAGGQYLGLNPAMQAAVMNPAIQGVNAGFNQLGRYGSSANVENSTEAAMRALMPYYDSERQRQGQAASLLPSMQQAWAGQLGQAGQMQEGIGARDIAEAQAQFAQQHHDPRLAALQAYGGLLAPGSQYGITTMQQPGGSPIAGALGGASMGAGLATSLWGPSAFAAGSFAAPFAWPMMLGAGLLGGLL